MEEEIIDIGVSPLCSMCEEAPATDSYGLPVCENCFDMLTGLEKTLGEMEAKDPKLKRLGERVEESCHKYLAERDGSV